MHGRPGADGFAAVEVAGRNWMMRRMLIDAIRTDPEWNGGNYTTQPRAPASQRIFGIATSGGTQALSRRDPPGGRRLSRSRLRAGARPMPTTSLSLRSLARLQSLARSRKDQARVLAINSADDERNPPELGIMEREIKRVKNGRFF